RSQAGVARQKLLRHRGSGEGDRLGRDACGDSIRRERNRVRVYPRGVMKPGLVVKLRPSGPWRIGPDSGARNRVDVIYHSDSLYSAVTSAMLRMGLLAEWLAATRSEEHTSELQSQSNLVCRLLLEKKKK